MKQQLEIENIGNLKDAETKIESMKIHNEIDNCIRLIKQQSGFGTIILVMHDKRITNIKATATKDLK